MAIQVLKPKFHVEECLDAVRECLEKGWTGTTVLCVLIFCVLHAPCSTTLLTIRKETGSRRWALLAALLPTALGLTLCALLAHLSRLL